MEFIKKWIEALRSGEYKQGKHSWYNKFKDEYCCLGVANKYIKIAADHSQS